MANPLEMGSVSPAPPNPDAGGNPLQGGPQASAAPAPPSYEQTVAALRHFDAVKGELTTLLNNPALGRSDIKSSVIDGTTKLVAERFMSPEDAVMQLSKVPTDPLQQRKWLQTMLAQTVQSENAVLDHYGAGNPHLGAVADHVKKNHGHKDAHMNHMKALQVNYGGKK